jgi:hypothetical protein
MVFGFGEIILPAFPPPDNTTNKASLGIPVLFPIDKAIEAMMMYKSLCKAFC